MAQALVALYAPYCQGLTRQHDLERALDLLRVGVLEGERPLRPQGSRRFEFRWQAGSSPLDPAQACLRIAASTEQPGADYSFELPTHRLVLWLMDALAPVEASGAAPDLPESFWFWLILGQPPAAEAP
jgi:hypothetical protein